MATKKLVFKEDEVKRLQTKIGQVSEDTNLLYLQLRGQASSWGGLPLDGNLLEAQVLINELTVEAEKLENIIRVAIKGVQGVQDENKRQANQLSQQFNTLGGMFGSIWGIGGTGRLPIPTFAQKASTNLISSIATLTGWDELNYDPMVQKLQATLKNPGLGTVDAIAAQSKLQDIYNARDLIAKAQTAFKVYQAFGNKAQMENVHNLAEDAREKLESMGVDTVHYQAGKDLSTHFKQPAVKACDYDPSITSANVPLEKNESYQLLLRMAMEPGDKGDWAKSQLASIHDRMGTSGRVKTYEAFWQQGEEYFNRFWWQDEEKVDAMIRVLREEVADKGKISLSEITDRNWMIGIQRISGALTKGQWDPSTNDVLQTIMTKYGIKEGDIWELTPKKLEAIIDRYKTGLIGQEFGDFLERTGYAEAVYEAAYGLHGYKSMSGGMTMSAAEADVAAVNTEFAAQQKAKVKALSNESVSESIKRELDEIKVKTEKVEGTGKDNLYDKEGKYNGVRNQEELDDLARDPASGGKIELKNIREREVGLAVEERGDLGRLIRDPQAENGAEFIDTTSGLKWDVKSFESYPSGDNGVPITNPKKGAFTIQQGMKKLQKEFDNGNNVIIDTRKMEPEHIEQLKKAIDQSGVADRIIWYP